jgi:hypothetical protein
MTTTDDDRLDAERRAIIAEREAIRAKLAASRPTDAELLDPSKRKVFLARVFAAYEQAPPIPLDSSEREAIAKLALGDMDAFVARAAADVSFPFALEALDALAGLIAPYERLRARLKAETDVRITELEKFLRARRPGARPPR